MGASNDESIANAIHLKKKPQPKPCGRLKVFLAYAEGVGATDAMLTAARQRQSEGIDVVIAAYDKSAWKIDDATTAGIEIIPAHIIYYENKPIDEIDIDAILLRQPQLVIAGSLSTASVPPARHPKLYQYLEELLANGINVFATLNIYDLVSLTDIISQKCGISIQGPVPDSVLENNAEIELVDLPVEELIQKFKAGQFQVKDDIQAYASQIYTHETLTTLRQLALQTTARFSRSAENESDFDDHTSASTLERLMVCISSHPLSERLVRTGYRLAADMKARWIVVYIETPDRLSFSPAHSQRITRTMRLAEELGASVTTVSGTSVAAAVVDFARTNAVTKIILGKPLRPRWLEILKGSIVDEIIRQSGPIDVYIVSDKSGPVRRNILIELRPKSSWQRYLLGLLLVCIVTIVCFPLYNLIEAPNLVMPYLLAVTLAAFYLGRGPSILSSLISALAFDFFFTHPRYNLNISDTQYIITFFGLIGVSLLVSNLASMVREQVEISQQREGRASALYSLSRDLTKSLDLQSILETIIQHISQTFSREAVILLPTGEDLEVKASSPGFVLESREKDVATWAFRYGKPAGRGTDNMPASPARYQPLATVEGVIGILGIKPSDPTVYLNPEQRQLLEAYASLAALAIESAVLAEQANQARVLGEGEKLKSAMLNSISHDLRTPLAAITGAFSSLHEVESGESGAVMDKATRLDLIENGWQEAEHLNRLVGNLLDMTRLESGAIRLNLEDCDIEDIIGAALTQMKQRLEGYPVKTKIPPVHPLVRADFMLIEQVLINLLDNAVKFSKAGDPIEITVWSDPSFLEVSVADHGPGIPPADLNHIFEKFFRIIRGDKTSGTGLGLSICKGIIEAHSGRIWAENSPSGGAVVSFTLRTAIAGGKDG